MATQTSQDSTQRKPGTSKNGDAYQYGASKEAALASAATPQDPASATGGGNARTKDVDVTWNVTGDVWIDVDPNSSAYINKYSLHVDHGSVIFDWQLDFNTQTTGDYRFWDSDNPKDYYDCKVTLGGNHNVCFNSKVPTISRVQYWSTS